MILLSQLVERYQGDLEPPPMALNSAESSQVCRRCALRRQGERTCGAAMF